MLTLRCICDRSGPPETRQSPCFRLEGKQVHDDAGKQVASLTSVPHP